MIEPKYGSIDLYWESDFSDWISEKMGKEWSIQQGGKWGEPCGQNTLLIFDVYQEAEDCDDVESAVTDWLAHKTPTWGVGRYDDEGGMTTDILLTYLCRKGEIPEGRYHMQVWW